MTHGELGKIKAMAPSYWLGLPAKVWYNIPMIQRYNGPKVTRTAFFQELMTYLFMKEPVTLRQIRAAFAAVKQLERQLETLIQAGYIYRRDRRYGIAFPLLEDVAGIEMTSEVLVDDGATVYEALCQLTFWEETTNTTNAVRIREEVDFVRENLTLSSYFYKLRHQLPMSQAQAPLYELLGDVNQEYALKYMTTFLLKFSRKERVIQKRTDIFVLALEQLGFIRKVDETAYVLSMDLDKEQLLFSTSKQKKESKAGVC